jgi:hypothetical protein
VCHVKLVPLKIFCFVFFVLFLVTEKLKEKEGEKIQKFPFVVILNHVEISSMIKENYYYGLYPFHVVIR